MMQYVDSEQYHIAKKFDSEEKIILHTIDKKYSVNINDELMEEIRSILENEKIWTEKC